MCKLIIALLYIRKVYAERRRERCTVEWISCKTTAWMVIVSNDSVTSDSCKVPVHFFHRLGLHERAIARVLRAQWRDCRLDFRREWRVFCYRPFHRRCEKLCVRSSPCKPVKYFSSFFLYSRRRIFTFVIKRSMDEEKMEGGRRRSRRSVFRVIYLPVFCTIDFPISRALYSV